MYKEILLTDQTEAQVAYGEAEDKHSKVEGYCFQL